MRISEAKHPGPLVSTATLGMAAVSMVVLSLFDGMGCAALSLRKCDASFDRYIGVENDEMARRICMNANRPDVGFPGVDHSWHSNVCNINEQDVMDLGVGNIRMLLFGAPCEDFSKLGLMPSKS
jgi:site-specific DNA-cytosine methylase